MSEDWGHVFNGEASIRYWSPAVGHVLAEQRVTKLRIRGWKHPTLDPLIPFRDQIVRIFWEVDATDDTPDLAALGQLHRLNHLSLRDRLEQIDFSGLRELQRLSAWADEPSFGNVRQCRSLQVLSITNCGLRDLTPLAGLAHLAELEIGEAPLKSLAGADALRGLRRLVLLQLPLATLSGIESLQQLEVLHIYMLGRLEGIAALTSLKRLKTISIGAARKIADLEHLGDIANLEALDLTGAAPSPAILSRLMRLKRLHLTNAGKLPSLGFLRSMKVLRELWLVEGTTVEDGDMSILLELPALTRVHFTNRKRYTHRHEDVQQTLLARSTTGVGAFDNAMAGTWFETLQVREPLSWAGTAIRDALSIPPPKKLPAMNAQYAVASAELVALLKGRRGRTTHYPPELTEWLKSHAQQPGSVLVANAVLALERVVTPPSGLLEVWTDRGQASEWLVAIDDLKARIVS